MNLPVYGGLYNMVNFRSEQLGRASNKYSQNKNVKDTDYVKEHPN